MNAEKSLSTKVKYQGMSPVKANTMAKFKNVPRRGQLVIKGLQKSFGGKVVYDSFDLELELGTFTSVFGPNGCGKSTLINMISGLMPRDGGSVLYDGRTIEETSISCLSKLSGGIVPLASGHRQYSLPNGPAWIFKEGTRESDRATYRRFRHTHRFKCIPLHAVQKPTVGPTLTRARN